MSDRKCIAEHGPAALRLFLGGLVLQHVPVLREDAIDDPDDVGCNPVALPSRS